MKQKRKYKQTTIKNMKFIDSETLYNRFIDKNSVLVKIHDTIDFSFVNELCDEVYCEDGQNAYLPELVFRVSFIQYFKNGISDNEVVRQCKTNLEYRYFCNLAIDDGLFDDCKLSRFRKEIGAERFKQIFDLLVEKIKNAGFISENDAQYMDSFLFLADVKIVSINSLLSKAIRQALKDLCEGDSEIEEDTKKRDFELSEEEQKKRFVFLVKKAQEVLAFAKNKKNLPHAANKSLSVLARIIKERAEITDNEIRKKETGEEKDKIISASDSDARMMGKKENEVAPRYKSYISMNKKGIITYTDATLATVYDGHHANIIVCDLKSRGFNAPVAVGDAHFGDMALRESMKFEGTQIVAPYRKNQSMNSCLTEDIMIEAWAYNHTPEYKEHMRIRAHTEPKQGEMKNLHGMKRARFRKLERIRVQNYMSAIVTNCKRVMAS
jgi:IS5 family transposase